MSGAIDPAEQKAIGVTVAEQKVEQMSDARLKADIRRFSEAGDGADPGREERVPASVMEAVMDAQGNVAMQYRMGPEDRERCRQAAQDLGRQAADALAAHPAALRGLFPSNKVRFVVKRRPLAPTTPEDPR